jgi:hypothetical protein
MLRRAQGKDAFLGAGFLLVAGPWIARNLALTGSPTALAIQNIALKAGDSTAEPMHALEGPSRDVRYYRITTE